MIELDLTDFEVQTQRLIGTQQFVTLLFCRTCTGHHQFVAEVDGSTLAEVIEAAETHVRSDFSHPGVRT